MYFTIHVCNIVDIMRMLNKNLSERFLLLQMKSEPVFLNDLQTRNSSFLYKW